jgi:excisionase family DNA binding protein
MLNAMSAAYTVQGVKQRKMALSVKEASQESGLSQPWLRLKIKDQSLRVVRHGRRILIMAEEFEKFLREGSK